MSMSATEVLTTSIAVVLGDILRTISGNKLVTILEEDGTLSVGTARSVVAPDDMSFNRGDVRDGRMWLTMRSGFERTIPMREVIERVIAGTIALDFDAG
jgi:hypothetical protein